MTAFLPDTLSPLLVPPGNGVYAVSTGVTWTHRLHDHLFGTHDAAQVKQAWHAQLTAGPDAGQVLLLGMPFDNGAGIIRGANWGPLALREAFYQQTDTPAVFDLGDIKVIPHLLMDELLNEATIKQCREALYGDASTTLPVSPLSQLDQLSAYLVTSHPEHKLITLGGDHSISYALVKNYLQAKTAAGRRAAVIHFDAHTDLLDQRMGLPITFGSWATHILPYLSDPSCLIQIGIRATGHDQTHWETRKGVKQFWADQVRMHGPHVIAEKILQHLLAHHIQEVYVSFDIDSLDQHYAAACGTPEGEGLTLEAACDVLDALKQQVPITGADIVEVAPFVSHPGIDHPEPQTTLHSAMRVLSRLID